jgi:hypothetical protein
MNENVCKKKIKKIYGGRKYTEKERKKHGEKFFHK